MTHTKPKASANRIGLANPLLERIAAIVLTLVVVASGLVLSPTVRESAAAFDRMQAKETVAESPVAPARIERVNHIREIPRLANSATIEHARVTSRRTFARELALRIWYHIERGLQLMRNTMMA